MKALLYQKFGDQPEAEVVALSSDEARLREAAHTHLNSGRLQEMYGEPFNVTWTSGPGGLPVGSISGWLGSDAWFTIETPVILDEDGV